jgi:hypothetical protein
MTPAIIEAAKNAVKIPYVHGHGDIGEVLVMVLRDEVTESEALIAIELLHQDYKNRC